MATILIIEDESLLARNIATYLQRHLHEVRVADSGEAGLAQYDLLKPDLVLLDYNLPGLNGLDVLARIRSRNAAARVVIMTGHGSERIAVEAMKAGATDYLVKPVELAHLRRVIEHALDDRTPPAPANTPTPGPAATPGEPLAQLVGTSAAMIELKQLITRLLDAERHLADAAAPAVLISGETGTGKELVARALHFEGRRRDKPFVEVNCSGIPANLLESELFGYERGAFTDAKEQKPGLIEAADHGTLFLDEIGELDPAGQAKLLKLLEEKQVRRLGSVRERAVNVRIIAATNRNLVDEVRAGTFRSDLYFRLGIIQVRVPPLRAREHDPMLLARHFLELHRGRYGKPRLELGEAAAQVLAEYQWPGNVRELRNVIEQAVILSRGDTIDPAGLLLSQSLSATPSPTRAADNDNGLNLHQHERELLVRALERTGWNVSRAARELGVSRDTLRYRIEKFQLRMP